MNQEKIDRYVDNLDVNTQADLLKKYLTFIFQSRKAVMNNAELSDLEFLEKQIDEFNEQFRMQEEAKE